MKWGGARKGAGRPKGTVKAESHRRKTRTVAAFDDEWELIVSQILSSTAIKKNAKSF